MIRFNLHVGQVAGNRGGGGGERRGWEGQTQRGGKYTGGEGRRHMGSGQSGILVKSGGRV